MASLVLFELRDSEIKRTCYLDGFAGGKPWRRENERNTVQTRIDRGHPVCVNEAV